MSDIPNFVQKSRKSGYLVIDSQFWRTETKCSHSKILLHILKCKSVFTARFAQEHQERLFLRDRNDRSRKDACTHRAQLSPASTRIEEKSYVSKSPSITSHAALPLASSARAGDRSKPITSNPRFFIKSRSRPLPQATSRINASAGSLLARGYRNDDGSIENVFWQYALKFFW